MEDIVIEKFGELVAKHSAETASTAVLENKLTQFAEGGVVVAEALNENLLVAIDQFQSLDTYHAPNFLDQKSVHFAAQYLVGAEKHLQSVHDAAVNLQSTLHTSGIELSHQDEYKLGVLIKNSEYYLNFFDSMRQPTMGPEVAGGFEYSRVYEYGIKDGDFKKLFYDGRVGDEGIDLMNQYIKELRQTLDNMENIKVSLKS